MVVNLHHYSTTMNHLIHRSPHSRPHILSAIHPIRHILPHESSPTTSIISKLATSQIVSIIILSPLILIIYYSLYIHSFISITHIKIKIIIH